MTITPLNSVVYVTRDLERALGPQTSVPSYFIITNSTPFAKEVASQKPNILLISGPHLLDTHELLAHPETTNYLAQLPNPSILVFKNTKTIETLCAQKQWPLLNPPAALSARVEEKISQVEWLGNLATYLPPHKIQILKEVSFSTSPFIIQFNRAHTGNGTILIHNEAQLQALQQEFPDRPVRVTDFIKGTMLTSNNVVFSDTIIVGQPNVQITGLPPFTDLPFATIGNDWSLAQKIVSTEQKNHYHHLTTQVGEQLRASGWRGLFGIDMMLADTGQLYIIEINARQPASTSFESYLQAQQQNNYTSFDLHLQSLLGTAAAPSITATPPTGAQIIVRNQATPFSESCVTVFCERLKTAGFLVTCYQNTEPGSDLVRIQSSHGLMKTPTELNESGQSIVTALNCSR